MRLSKHEVQTIRHAVQEADPQAKVCLFGSRLDDSAKGGDIDLLVISESLADKDAGAIRWKLWEQLGEQKIDILISPQALAKPFARLVYAQSEPL